MTSPQRTEPPLHALLRGLRTDPGVEILNLSGYGPVLVTLGCDAEVETVARYYRRSPQRVSQDRVACGVKVAGVLIQFLGDRPASDHVCPDVPPAEVTVLPVVPPTTLHAA
ncbi:hypothetical protein [Nocardioides pakistanensis]